MKAKHPHAAHRASRYLSLALVLAMLVSLFTAMLPTAYAADEPAADLTITTLDDLKALATAVDDGNSYAGKTIVLAADIDASSENWNPIGACISSSEFVEFAGAFDGQGHSVTLKIESPTEKYLGLFAYNSGTIKNLVVRGSISGSGYLGGICGYNAGTITGCINYAAVSGTATCVGGITGYGKATVCKIENCANYGSIITSIASGNAAYIGGIVGQTTASTYINSCYNAGTVTSNKGYTGGVVGYSMSTIQDCYNAGAVSSSVASGKTIGGIVGALMGSGTLANCYNTGTVTAVTPGAIAGTAYNGKFANCYYLEGSAAYGICSLSSTDGLKTADEMKSQTFAATLGDAFKPVANDFPVLTWQKTEVTPHEHSYTASETTAATCTQPGVMTYTCACGDSYTEEIPAPGHDLTYENLLDGTHKESCSRCDYSKTEECAYINGVCACGAKEPEEIIPDCKVYIGIGITNSSFTVPFGKTLDITWEFLTIDGIPKGWQMLVNGDPVDGSNDSSMISSVPTMARIVTTGHPEDIIFTPTKEQCQAGEPVTLTAAVTKLTKEQREFALNFVDRNTNKVVGSYAGEDGSGYHASEQYGAFTISATKTTTIKNWVTKNLPGYRLYAGTPGNVDKQEITLLVGENGVAPKSANMYVEVNHSTISPLHTQKVQFMDGEELVLETSVPLKNAYTGTYTGAVSTIELDLTAAAEQLAALGYEFDQTQIYTVNCDNYTHDPDVTVIPAVKKAVFPFEYTIENDVVTITKYIGEKTIVDVPSTIEGKPVVAVGLGAFAKNDTITKVVLPASVTSIGQAAFSSCAKLERINLENVTSFGPYAFLGCGSLNEVVLNDEITTLPVFMFSECSSLAKVHLPGNLTALSNHLFDACESLTTVEIPESVTMIDRCAFEEAGLVDLVIPDSVTSIGDYAFDGCAKLERITLGAGLETMGDLVFWKCTSLKSVVIPEKVTVIPTGTFFDCTALESVTIGRNVTEIKDNAFKNCSASIHGYPDSAAFTYAKNNGIPFVCIEHIFGDWTVTKEASCTEAGTETRTCACGETESREIPTLGHKAELKNAKDATCAEPGYTGDEVCSVCGETVKAGSEIPALGHKWDDGKVTTAPTYETEGVKTFTCSVCGETRTESIPKLVKPNRPFADVKKGDWFYDDVYACFDAGLLVGVSDTEFLPNGAMTRAMLATVLYRMAGSPEVSYQDVFTDVADGEWYSDAIVWASTAGVVCGYPDGTFQPMTSITREEMVSMLYRFAKLSDPELGEITPDLSAFRDGSDAYDYAVVPLSWASQTGLIVGMGDNVLAPNGTATRAQAATLLVRYCALMEE